MSAFSAACPTCGWTVPCSNFETAHRAASDHLQQHPACSGYRAIYERSQKRPARKRQALSEADAQQEWAHDKTWHPDRS